MTENNYTEIIKFYISYINKGKITIADVPLVLQEEVRKTLAETKGDEV